MNSDRRGMSGQQIAELNVQTFAAWVASKSDDDFRGMTHRNGVLSRKEIAVECGFAKSALDQNPRVCKALIDLETALRKRGVLPPAVTAEERGAPLMREGGSTRRAQDAERLMRLEQENASLKVEVAELRRLLEKHTILSDALAATGRIPR